MRRWTAILAVMSLAAAACAGSDGESTGDDAVTEVGDEVIETDIESTETTATDTIDTEPVATDPPVTDPVPVETDAPVEPEPVETDPVDDEVVDAPDEISVAPWAQIPIDSEDCACSDGSEFQIYERPGDPERVMFYFEGGGACFSLATCDPNGDPTYSTAIDPDTADRLGERGGLFDQTNAENPLAGHSVVYVPYCTGDVFLGNATTEYSDEVTIEHRGAANTAAAIEYLVANYPDAQQLVVTGASAGSVPTPLVAGLLSDELPDAEIVTFGDSSGAYPDVPAVNELIGNLWGTTVAVPDWPVNEGLTAADWSIPDLYVQAGAHAPDITFARFDYAFDDVQATFSALAGVAADQVVQQIDATEAQVEATGVPIATYVAPGTEHTIMAGNEVYEMEVEGVRLIDWITELIDGGVPADVHCVECEPPGDT